ncbi:MAG: L-seryl-tRNA(Sec) selenium transferase [Dehalococcoidia bacterium]
MVKKLRNASQSDPGRFRTLPSVDQLAAAVLDDAGGLDAAIVTELTRETLADARRLLAAGQALPDLQAGLRDRLRDLGRPSLRPVINATGVIIHTNLGRAPLSAAARAAMASISQGYSNLEFDLDSGARGSRHSHLETLLRRVTGAEAGFAVNNNAAAILLVLSALCAGREVIISRGQLVEIGGGFRIPDVLRQSGARLVEVGTTNRTYARDYVDAITPETAALLRVHSSNFRVIGFTHEAAPHDLATLARKRGLLLLDDIGSGALLDTTRFGLAPEPTVQQSIAAGAYLTMFSGDKLLGGPQAGIIVGRRDLVDTVRRHPLARAVRLDKASIAALAATLGHYARGEALREVPIWRMIATPLAEIEQRAARWAQAIGGTAAVVDARSMIGGGSLPEESLPTRAMTVRLAGPTAAAAALRRMTPPIVARIERDQLYFDPRTVMPEDDATVAHAAALICRDPAGSSTSPQ